MMSVVARHQMRADFMLQQCVDSPPRNSRPAADEQAVARNHEAGVHVVAHRNRGREIGAALLIVAEFLLRALGELGRVELAAFGAAATARRHAVEQFGALFQQPIGNAAVNLQALLQELRRIDVRQQRDLAIELILLLSKQIRKRRVFDSLDRNQIKLPLEQHRIDRQRPIVKHGRLLESRPAKLAPGALRVHGRRLQQQIERAIDLGQLPVDIQNRFHDRRPPGA